MPDTSRYWQKSHREQCDRFTKCHDITENMLKTTFKTHVYSMSIQPRFLAIKLTDLLYSYISDFQYA